ncbi:MAG: PDZ domain-containing protein, partial [Candidatus Nanopelagicales bacterium]
IAEELIRSGVAQYPIVGVNLDLTYGGSGARILPSPEGTREPVTPGGPADDAGLLAGDVIVAVDNEAVDTYEEFVVTIRTHSPGDTVTLQVNRDGESLSIDVVLGSTEG